MAEEWLSQREGQSGMKGRDHKMRIGHGYDVHRLVEGRPLIVGGVAIPFDKGLLGHSDADVLAHAVSDALLLSLIHICGRSGRDLQKKLEFQLAEIISQSCIPLPIPF